jgi:hypothetical protein
VTRAPVGGILIFRLALACQRRISASVVHYTLNTGHAVASPRSGVSQEAIQALQPLSDRGGPIPGCAPFRVEVTRGAGSAVFTVWRGQEPVVTCGLAWTVAGEAEAWPAIEKLYLDLSDSRPELLAPAKEASKPASLPWLAVVLLQSLLTQSRNDVSWLGDFERCLAWTILSEDARSAGGTYSAF